MNTLAWFAGTYLAGFVLIQILFHFGLRDEPTDHGKIVGHQIGCIVSVLWPFALVYLLVVGLLMGATLVWKTLSGGRVP